MSSIPPWTPTLVPKKQGLRSKFLPPLITLYCGLVLLFGGGFGCFVWVNFGKKPWVFLWAMLAGLILSVVAVAWLAIAAIVKLLSKREGV